MSAVRFLYIVRACSKFQVNDTSPMLSVFQRYLDWLNFDQTAIKLAVNFCYKMFLFLCILEVFWGNTRIIFHMILWSNLVTLSSYHMAWIHIVSFLVSLGLFPNFVCCWASLRGLIDWFLFPSKSSENLWFWYGFRGNGG